MREELEQPTIYDLEGYEQMINRLKLSTFVTNNIFLYGVVLKKNYKSIEEVRNNLPHKLYLYDEMETALTYGLKRINEVTSIDSGMLITVQINPTKILDTLNLSGIKCLSDTYTEMYNKDNSIFKPVKDKPGQKSKKVNPDWEVIKYLFENKRITGIRRLITEGNKIYTDSIFNVTRYVRYEIYDKSIIQNITITNQS